jgi:hypothetical protein
LANAQLLIYVVRPSEISSASFQAAAATAARSRGLTPGRWTYAAVAVSITPAADSRIVGVVSGGPFDGTEVTFGSAFTPGRFMLSAYRLNLAGLPDEGSPDAQLSGFTTVLREALGASSSTSAQSVRAGFKTLRSRLPWDRDVPEPIALEVAGAGGGIGWGVLAAIAAVGVAVAANRQGGLRGYERPRRRRRGGRR